MIEVILKTGAIIWLTITSYFVVTPKTLVLEN